MLPRKVAYLVWTSSHDSCVKETCMGASFYCCNYWLNRKHPSFSSNLNWKEIHTTLATFIGSTQEVPRKHMWVLPVCLFLWHHYRVVVPVLILHNQNHANSCCCTKLCVVVCNKLTLISFSCKQKKSVVSALVFNIKAVWQTIMNAFDFHRYPIYMWLQLGGNLFDIIFIN